MDVIGKPTVVEENREKRFPETRDKVWLHPGEGLDMIDRRQERAQRIRAFGVSGRKACLNDSVLLIVSQRCASYRKRGRARTIICTRRSRAKAKGVRDEREGKK